VLVDEDRPDRAEVKFLDPGDHLLGRLLLLRGVEAVLGDEARAAGTRRIRDSCHRMRPHAQKIVIRLV
jgi:hypothetical protein